MTKALVVGSGVGGLTAAIALGRAGVEVELVERARELRSIQVGGGLHIWPNGMRAFEELGVGSGIVAAGRRIARLDWLAPEHGLLASADLAATADRIGAPSVGIRRADLLAALVAAVGEESIRLDAELVAFEQDAGGVTARLADGRELTADMLIGADGLHSVVRRQLVGESDLRTPGVLVAQATVDGVAAEDEVFVEVWAPGLRFGCYPVRGGAFWFAFVRAADAGSLDQTGVREHLLARTGNWAVAATHLIAATAPSEIGWAEVVAREPLGSWSDGRVTLLGDSAHAMTPFLGQGACQAIEDALVLGRCLSGSADEREALQEYDTVRLPRVSEIWSRSWAAARSHATKSRTIDPSRREAFAAAFERVVWKQLEKTIVQRV